jgi:3-methyladenine DNA glycosylase AlkD
MNVAALAVEITERYRSSSVRNTPALRTLRREYSKRIAKAPAQDVLALARRLLQISELGLRFLAYELILKHPAALASLREREILQLGRGLASWSDVDMFACYLAGPAWREGQVGDSLIRRWTKSADRWWRRAALVATVPLNNKTQGGHGDARRTLAVCRLLVADRDDMVYKALSWALRELAKRDPRAVKRFLEERRHQAHPRVRREVMSKLTTGLKNPRRI